MRASGLRTLTLTTIFVTAGSRGLAAQTSTPQQLPEMPVQSLTFPALNAQAAQFPSQAMGQTASQSGSGAPAPAPGQIVRLTRIQAEQLAIRNNPRISVGRLLALAQHQVFRETRAAELPTAMGAISAIEAEEASRISAGSLTASRLFEHVGAGGGFTQLITDFGRTTNLVASSRLEEAAQNASALATTEDIVLATDQAFYNALQAQALVRVADQTVLTRQTTETQVSELTKNNLKSTLDLSFADVTLSQAKLLQLDAGNNLGAAMAALTAVLGFEKQAQYELVEETASPSPPPPDADMLTDLAMKQRPDLQALNLTQQADLKFSRAQRDQMFPTISALGTAGGTPVRPDRYYVNNWWGAIGVNVNVPIFNGFLFSAQAAEARFRAQAAAESARDLRDTIARDVHTSWLQATTAFQRLAVTAQLLNEANMSLTLAQTRYQLGLSSIVELSQAQLQQTQAAIDSTNADYQYRLALATLNFETGVQP